MPNVYAKEKAGSFMELFQQQLPIVIHSLNTLHAE